MEPGRCRRFFSSAPTPNGRRNGLSMQESQMPMRLPEPSFSLILLDSIAERTHCNILHSPLSLTRESKMLTIGCDCGTLIDLDEKAVDRPIRCAKCHRDIVFLMSGSS